MKKLRLILIAALLLIAAALCAQSHYQGNVTAQEPYEVHILNIPKNGIPEFIRWELWEYYEEYRITVQPLDRVEALWISQCTGDTIARAFFNGERKRIRLKSDISILPGDVLEFGTWPFHKENEVQKSDTLIFQVFDNAIDFLKLLINE